MDGQKLPNNCSNPLPTLCGKGYLRHTKLIINTITVEISVTISTYNACRSSKGSQLQPYNYHTVGRLYK